MYKYSKRFSAIIIFIALYTTTYSQDVYWEPTNPIQGGQVTIYYNLENRNILPAVTNPVYLHLGFDGWSTGTVNDYAMTKSQSTGLWEYELSIPQNVSVIDFAFTDNIIDYSAGTWDNNGGFGEDWHIDVYSEGLSVVVVSPEVEKPYGDPFRSPVFTSQSEVIPILITTVTDGVV